MQRPSIIVLFFIYFAALPLQAAEVVWEPPKWLPKSWFDTSKGGQEETAPLPKKTADHLWQTAQKYENQGKMWSTLRAYRKLAKRYPDSPYAPEALYRMGEIQVGRKNYKKAHQAFEQLLTQYPNFGSFNYTIQRQYEIAVAMVKGKTSKFLWLIPYQDKGTATQFLETVVNNAPFNDYAPYALMCIADIQKCAKKTNESIATLNRMISEYPEHPLTAKAYLRLAEAYTSLVKGPEYDQGATQRAMEYYEDFLLLYPKDHKTGLSEQRLAKMRDELARSKLILGHYYYRYRNNNQAAKAFFNEAITLAPNSAAATEAQEGLAKIASTTASVTESL